MPLIVRDDDGKSGKIGGSKWATSVDFKIGPATLQNLRPQYTVA